MTRYEHAGKFWTIARDGAALTITSGKIGNKGRTVVKHHASVAEATAAHDKLVVEKQREGFRIVEKSAPAAVAATVDDRGPALEAAIIENPDDAAAFAVYGDWLLKHGDTRGELVALTQTSEPKEIGKYIAKHATALLGSLAARVTDLRDPKGPPFQWKNGFIRRADLETMKACKLDDDLAALFAHTSAKFLVELAIRAYDRREALAVLELLDRAPPTLRDFELFARANLDDIDGRNLPKLHKLGITARAFDLSGLSNPTLRRAQFRATSISSTTIQSIAAAPWPMLERLEIRFCGPTGATETDLAELRPLLHRTDMPALTHLRLRGCPFAGGIARELLAAPLSRQLQLLDFSQGNFTPQDVAALAKAASNFPNLVELWMPHTTNAAPLATVAKRVIPDSKGPTDTLDYDLAGERVPRGDERYGGIRE